MELVSVLVPAYKPTFLRQALSSAISQTYRNIEVLVGDDCPTEEVAAICAGFPSVQYHRNPNFGGRGQNNIIYLMGLARGHFIKFLFDDDLLRVDCIEKMVAAASAVPSVSMVFSPRTVIDENGAFIRTLNPLQVNQVKQFEKKELIRYMGRKVRNPIGELTSILMRAQTVDTAESFSVAGQTWRGLGDVALFVNLLELGYAVAIPEPLTYFRSHAGQNTAKRDYEWTLGFSDWLYLIDYAYRSGVINRLRAVRSCYRLLRDVNKMRNESDALPPVANLITGQIKRYVFPFF